ncbi:GTP 3',8-cyclase MoaA [Fontisphaera persica]|uniref:GTP 3',8-cyclase MoaA n=1 Tax=Fontisphaera persica TaxID=2974023 RepID=UPI0024BF3F06|nr:GTP 3',8-cyclase MoaA [Fontisphaera persica]WCJ57977.1 GTP 3',8-cyclase MoaA [Fontisphaera persica]
MDAHGRTLDYLRLSITDRCNERCLYCMPEGYHGWRSRPDHLTREEIVRVARTAARLGFRKFRLTGGEPLVRADVVDIARDLASLPGVSCVALSTNGLRLAELAAPLRAAGLRTVNISLDALNPELYRRITGGSLARVLAGIRAAVACGFECIKLNCVLMRGVNEQEIWPLTLFAAEHGLPLRLIELMPITSTEVLDERHFLPVAAAMRLLQQHDDLIPVPEARLGWGPARYYRLRHTGALVGFIGALTTPHFCDQCNKMRLTADGKIRPCLGDHGELDLRALLRRGASDAELEQLLQEAMARKPLAHSFRQGFTPCRPMTAIGG